LVPISHFPANQTEGKGEQTVKEVVDRIGDFGKGRSQSDGVAGDAVAAIGERRDEGEVGGSYKGRVETALRQLLRANQDGSELQDGETLAGSGRDGGLDVEENDLGSILGGTHQCLAAREFFKYD